MRQDDDPQPGRRAHSDHQRRHHDRRPRGQRPRSQGPGHRHGVPELRALPQQDGLQEPRLPAADAPDVVVRDRPEGARGRAHARHDPPARAQAPGVVGRPAATCRARPRACPQSGRLPDGRAAVQSRRQAARADALRDQAVPPGFRRDDHLRDPRPARGRHHGRQDGRHERRLPAAVRHARAGLRPSREPVRRQLHRQSRDEPHPAGGEHGRRPDRPHQRRGMGPDAFGPECAKGAERDVEESRAGRASLDDPAAQVAGRGQRAGQGLHGRAHRRRDLRAGVPVGQRSSTSACRRPSRSNPTNRCGSSSTRSACTSSMARPNWPCKRDHGPEAQDHRHQALSGLGRHPQPADRQGRDRPGGVRLGRKRPVVAREGGGRRHRALPRVSHRPGRHADRPHLAGDVSQPVLRRRPRPAGRDLGDRHRAARHQGQGARRAGVRSARAASSAISFRPSRPRVRKPRARKSSSRCWNSRNWDGRRSA